MAEADATAAESRTEAPAFIDARAQALLIALVRLALTGLGFAAQLDVWERHGRLLVEHGRRRRVLLRPG